MTKTPIGAKVKAAVGRAFDKIGSTNGTAQPDAPTQDTLDKAAHELLVASTLKSAAERRHKQALENFLNHVDMGKIRVNVDWVKKHDTSTEFSIGESTNFNITATITRSTTRLDEAKLAVALAKAGISKEITERIINEATTVNEPAKRFIVAER